MKRRSLCLITLLAPLALQASRWSLRGSTTPRVAASPVTLEIQVGRPFHFVVYGDTRFHDPSDTRLANPDARRALVGAIDKERPAFISISGDIVHTGSNHNDWQVWEKETAVWREHKITVYPALGNHDLGKDVNQALADYFAHFPELKGSRFYSVRAGNSLLVVLDSSEEEVSGAQGDWLQSQLNHVSADVDFVFLVFHHPVYTGSAGGVLSGGHSARPREESLGQFLEAKQKTLRARLVVLNGHVHNYERYERGGVTYIVTGGGGAPPYYVVRHENDPYRDTGVNYHYLLMEVDGPRLNVMMKKLELEDNKEVWTHPDAVTLTAPATAPATDD